MTDDEEEQILDGPMTDDDVEPDEYNVEAIRSKRRNPKSGAIEYLIKWENWPESSNTWEPIENLKCPDIIAKFNEQEKNKRKKRRATTQPASTTKRTRKGATDSPIDDLDDVLLVEDEADNGDDNASEGTETVSSASGSHAADKNQAETRPTQPPVQPKGFERGLSIERIVGSCTDDKDGLWFFVKWCGLSELELVSANDLEENAPREMCSWYRERLYYSLGTATDPLLAVGQVNAQ